MNEKNSDGKVGHSWQKCISKEEILKSS